MTLSIKMIETLDKKIDFAARRSLIIDVVMVGKDAYETKTGSSRLTPVNPRETVSEMRERLGVAEWLPQNNLPKFDFGGGSSGGSSSVNSAAEEAKRLAEDQAKAFKDITQELERQRAGAAATQAERPPRKPVYVPWCARSD